MNESGTVKPRFFLKHTLITAVLGLATGSITGQLAAGSVFLLRDYSLGTSLGIWLFFTLIFAGIGIILGVLLDVDARERAVAKSAITSQATPSERP